MLIYDEGRAKDRVNKDRRECWNSASGISLSMPEEKLFLIANLYFFDYAGIE